MKKYKVKIAGTAPLLQNKIPLLDTGATKKGEGKDSPEHAEGKLHKIGGKICEPAIHLERALEQAATGIKLKGQGKKSYKQMFIGSVFVKPEMIPHLSQKWKVHASVVNIPSTRGKIARYRPMIEGWSLAFEVEALDDRLPKDVLKLALDEAGRQIGIGDWRPRFGRFVVEEFKEA